MTLGYRVQEEFVSRTKLFNHVNEEGHAQAMAPKGGTKKGKKGKR